MRLPRLSNFTDFSALSRVPGVGVSYADKPAQLEGADLIILPGTKSTLGDLKWLRESGMEAQILKQHAAGTPVFGVCGGYQIMGQSISDPEGAEGGGSLRGCICAGAVSCKVTAPAEDIPAEKARTKK